MSDSDRDSLVERLSSAVSVLSDVSPKNMLGANGFAKGDKVFCMVTKDTEVTFKVTDDLAHEHLSEQGGTPWSPHGKKFGSWLKMPENLQDSEDSIIEWAALAHGGIE